MALQQKSTNLPEMQEDAIPKVSAAAQFMINPAPGSENTPVRGVFENLQQNHQVGVSPCFKSQAKVATPSKRSSTTPTQNEQVNNEQALQAAQKEQQQQQQQQQKPSRTDNCHCPEIIEEKVKPVCVEDQDKPRKINKYQKGRFLGKGGFAKCYEVKRLEPIETEEHKTRTWALKVVPKANLTRTKARQKLTSEIKIHRSLDNEYVVRFDRYFEDKENVYIMLDICQNQSLSDLIKRRKRLHEVEARYYIYQLCQALKYIHSRKVIHRDLKLGNLFLTEKMGLKVGDFGLAAQVFFQGERKRTVCGTPNYLAPEVLDAERGHSYEVDYWGIGVILYTMLNGRPPFESQEVKYTYRKIKSASFSFPENVQFSQFAKDFIKKSLIVDTNLRMNLDEMLEHDFLSFVPIPDQIPVSTLVCPPASAFVKMYGLPAKQSLSDMSPSPMGSKTIRQQRMHHHMQTAPMENMLRQTRTQKSVNSKENNQYCKDEDNHKAMYSPLITNRGNSQCENGQIMASARDGGTPNAPAFGRQASTGGALISEFNPLNEDLRGSTPDDVLQNPTCIKTDGTVVPSLKVDNFLPQNVVLSGLKPREQSPKPAAQTSTARMLNLENGLNSGVNSPNRPSSCVKNMVTGQTSNGFSAKRHTLTKSGSSSKIGVTNGLSNKHLMSPNQRGVLSTIQRKSSTNEACNSSKNADQAASNQIASSQNDLAKIQPTSAETIQHELLAQKSDDQPRTELVTKFVDFSSKYGLGYMLSNGSYGVHFNDATKIVLHPNLFHFDYIERPKQTTNQAACTSTGQAAESVTDQVSHFDFFDYPESINKKVVLLQHFKSYLDGNQKFKPLEFSFTKENAPKREQNDDGANLCYVKKWKRAKKAILLRNTNKIIQVMFQDQSELIICSGSGFVTFVNSKQDIKTIPLSTSDENLELSDRSLFKRLQYAKEILVQMMSAASMPAELQITRQLGDEPATAPQPRRKLSQVGLTSPRTFSNNRQTISSQMKQAVSTAALNTLNTLEQRTTKSAQKLLLSPAQPKTTCKPATKTQRLQTYNSFKLGSNSAIKANPSKSKFELPMLNSRSNSKPTLTLTNQSSSSKMRESQSKQVMSTLHQTHSHNFLPAKHVVNGAIQTLNVNVVNPSGSLSAQKTNNGSKAQLSSVARLYQSQQPGQNGSSKDTTNTSGNCTGSSMGATAPKVSQNKSPGKTFKRVGSQSNGTLLRKSLIVKPSF